MHKDATTQEDPSKPQLLKYAVHVPALGLVMVSVQAFSEQVVPLLNVQGTQLAFVAAAHWAASEPAVGEYEVQPAEGKQVVPINVQLDKYALQVAAEGLEIESAQVFSVQLVPVK